MAMALPVIEFLNQRGFKVTYVPDGLAAVQSFQAEPPDLIIMDVMMPGLNGIEATRRIRGAKGSRWVPVILMTALGDQAAIVAGLDAGADEYLIKPVNFEVLDARLRAMRRIAAIQDSLRGILDNVHEGIITIDGRGTIRSYNKAAERIFGYSETEVTGKNVKCLMPSPYAEQHDGYLERYQHERIPHIIGIGRKVQGRRKDGAIFPMKLAVTEVRSDEGVLFIGLVNDISREEKDRQRIEFLALHDPLTGLPNRAHFKDALDRLLLESTGQTHALFFIDLDGFKPINDSLGHEGGDEALRVVAGRLRHELASKDFVARLGGDEFVVIARNVRDATAVRAIGDRLITAISRPMAILGEPCRMGASIGVAIAPECGTTADEILVAADNAMYEAKHSGKGRLAFALGRRHE